MCLAKLQRQTSIICPSVLSHSQMGAMINLVPKVSGEAVLLEALFGLMKRVLRFAFKRNKAIDRAASAAARMRAFLGIREIFTLKEIFFGTSTTSPEALLLKTHALDLFTRLICTHQKLGNVERNEYLGIFKHGFTACAQVIKARLVDAAQHLSAAETEFVRSFLRLFQKVLQKRVPLDAQIFESRNDLVNLFFFPLLSLDERELALFAEDPKEFVHYGQDVIDKHHSRTLKCDVFLLFDLLCEKADGFHVFVSDYLGQLLLYTSHFLLFNDAAASRLESLYSQAPPGSFVASLESLFPSPRNHFEHSLLKFLGEDASTRLSFSSARAAKKFYEDRGRGRRESALRRFPADVDGAALTPDHALQYLEKTLQLLTSTAGIADSRGDIEARLAGAVELATLPLLLLDSSLVLVRFFNFFTFTCDVLFCDSGLRMVVFFAFDFLSEPDQAGRSSRTPSGRPSSSRWFPR